jgi:peroxiredoxin
MNDMKRFLPLLGTLVLGLFLWVAATPNAADGLEVGDTAPNFELKGTDGEMHSLDDYPDANGYIVIFTCNHCPYAKMYEDRIIALHNEYASKGYPVIAINPNDPEVVPEDGFKQMKKRAKEKEFPFLYLFDDGQKVYPAYGATRTPHVYLLDSDRKVRYIGAIDDSPRNEDAVEVRYVEDAIAALEAGNNPDPDFTKAIGCSIKTQ